MGTSVQADVDIEAEIQRALPRNFTLNLLDGAFFIFGMSFSSVVTILPLFVSQLTSSPFLIGLIPAIQNMGWLLPQLFTAPLVERMPRKKPFVLLTTLSERWPYVGMVILAVMLPNLATTTALVIFFALHTWRCFSGGITATAWQDMIGKLIPPRRRGTFYGVQFGLGGLLGAGGSIIAGSLLEQQPFPINFAYCFGLTVVAVAFSFIFVTQTYEPAMQPTVRRETGRAYWASLPRILQGNTNYRNFVLYRVLYVIGSMGSAFYTVYVVNEFGLSKVQAGQLTFVMMAAQTVTYPLAGWIGDRMGHRRMMAIAAAAASLMTLLSWLAPSGVWFFGVYLLFGIASAASMVANLSAIYDFCAPEERPTYIGLTATIVGIPSAVAPLLGGLVVSTTSYPTLFGLTIVFCFASWAMVHWGIREPRHEVKGVPVEVES